MENEGCRCWPGCGCPGVSPCLGEMVESAPCPRPPTSSPSSPPPSSSPSSLPSSLSSSPRPPFPLQSFLYSRSFLLTKKTPPHRTESSKPKPRIAHSKS
ncbi:hypothetical protein K474DRAFT_616382 [Panus rudis PR-1116 ss-1]|nr:hypothetical protein K474DRAFT_616382 [Panus rudis PR-1116 ss-1]